MSFVGDSKKVNLRESERPSELLEGRSILLTNESRSFTY